MRKGLGYAKGAKETVAFGVGCARCAVEEAVAQGAKGAQGR